MYPGVASLNPSHGQTACNRKEANGSLKCGEGTGAGPFSGAGFGGLIFAGSA
jgi:hypothetical protein